MMLSFVTLVKIRSHHAHNELDRLKNIQLKSFRKFLDLSILKDFFIVAPKEDIPYIKGDLLNNYPEFPFIFVDEDVLCPSLKGTSGWTKQMICKLAVSNIVETDFYLTLDTDVFLTKPLSSSDIFHEGKLIYQYANPRSHLKWWMSSCHILNVSPDIIIDKEHVMGITPEYLVTDICRRLQKEIEELHTTNDFASWLMLSRLWKNRLLNRVIREISASIPFNSLLMSKQWKKYSDICDWTEYSLYWVYLNKLQMVDRYYAETYRGIYGNCIWVSKEIRGNELTKLIAKTFEENQHYHFSIIQSSIRELDQHLLAELIGNYLS